MKRKLKRWILKNLFKRVCIVRKCDCGNNLSEWFIKNKYDKAYWFEKFSMWCPTFIGCGKISNHRRHIYKRVFKLKAN